jgi:hypothetical protein
MKKYATLLFLLAFSLGSARAQNWSTTGGSSQRNGIAGNWGPESVITPAWSIDDAPDAVWGGTIFTSGNYFATCRVSFSPNYHVTAECRLIADGSLVWEKAFPGDARLYLVGMNEDAVYLHNYLTDSLFSLNRITGEIQWVCPQKSMTFGGAHGLLFTCNGDPVANGPDLYQHSLMRLDKYTGEVTWFNSNLTSVGPATDYCIFGDRLYRWEGAIGVPTHLVAVDLETGESLFYSDPIGGDADQEHPLTAGPDGTIYGMRDGGDLWAFTDDGTTFSVKWFYSPVHGGMGTYGNIGIGPDGSVYFQDGQVVNRLDPSTGDLLNTSMVLAVDLLSGTYITTDLNGTVYISNAQGPEGKYFAFTADLQTLLWEKAVPYNIYAGPQISKDGIFIMNGSGSAIEAYKTTLPHPPVSWFEADRTSPGEEEPVYFTDMTSFAPTSWHWIFEGGIPAESNLQDPGPVVFRDPGVYSITLITSNALGSDTLIRECYMDVIAIPGTGEPGTGASLALYPNPCDGTFRVLFPEPRSATARCIITDMQGRVVHETILEPGDETVRTGLTAGVYMVKIVTDQVTVNRKVVVE